MDPSQPTVSPQLITSSLQKPQSPFIILLIIFLLALIFGLGGYVLGVQQTLSRIASLQPSPTPSPISIPTGKYCLEVLTPARNIKTNECYVFPTSCISEGWVVDQACSSTLTPTPGAGAEKIIKEVGEEEGSFLIQKINPDSVEGLWFQKYPNVRLTGSSKILYIGDDIGYGCEGVSERLTDIDFSGQRVTFTKVVGKAPLGGCPICLSEDTTISTPQGEIRVTKLKEKMQVWTVDKEGKRVAVPILKVLKMSVSSEHVVVHLVLKDGRQVYVSKGHPTVDGRTVDQLRLGELYNGSFVTKTEIVRYDYGYTYDLLPSGDTGYYFANGILLGSTLR